MNQPEEVFMVRARKCKRCGGLLTSKRAIEDGYGHTCKMRAAADRAESQPLAGQVTLLDLLGETQEKKGE